MKNIIEMGEFKSELAENVFRNKYSQGANDTWAALSRRVVEDVCNTKEHPLMSKEDQDYLVKIINEKKFIPGGRYLYYAGRDVKFFNNCFKRGTKVLTDKGWRAVEETGKVNVLSPVDGEYYSADFMARGIQKLNKITFANFRGHQGRIYEIYATRTHHWFLKDGTDTYDLRVGDVVPANNIGVDRHDPSYEQGLVHGFVFGDGNEKGQLRLCGEKDKKWLSTLEKHGTVTYPKSAEGDPVLYFGVNKKWKNLPSEKSSVSYISGFINGWLLADGSETSASFKLCSVNKEALEWFREYAPYSGLVITGNLRSQTRDISIGKYEYKNHLIYIQTYTFGGYFNGFKVISIEEQEEEEEVFCPYEPVHNRIVIDHGIDTFNCYLLRAERDTREEWADVVWRSTKCLMVGGGIGIDYSRIRPSGRALHRTGGIASGPISLMQMINEVGRYVMQGGSRRSAIYASLNWQHEDAEKFLTAKNWTQEIRDLKERDFNFPAPLDMTNISLNYDDWFFKDYHPEGLPDNLPETFVENCRQALKTGEPGFSFNFGAKENETLRNACTEVTSEDDSDVCNLGSINMGAIDTLEEFQDIVRCATGFLVCGTVRAELPYSKVYEVREKNRRLGLGIMGVHEWLLKKGFKYEVNDELKGWLQVYEGTSRDAARDYCNGLNVSNCVATRAVAPTGTIGILAGTTTGIEPLFAVAYKRRYLKAGTKWHYQFVIDPVADMLIKEYGLDPDKIETATDLAEDYERRIKFQAEVQDYVDHAISSTINLPSWNSDRNNDGGVESFSKCLARYAHRLRGFTCYPDGARGGQPIVKVPYKEALGKRDVEYLEHESCIGGVCGL